MRRYRREKESSIGLQIKTQKWKALINEGDTGNHEEETAEKKTEGGERK